MGGSVSVVLVSLEVVSCPLGSEDSASSDVDSPGVATVSGERNIQSGNPVKA